MSTKSTEYQILKLILQKMPTLSAGEAGAIARNIKTALKGL